MIKNSELTIYILNTLKGDSPVSSPVIPRFILKNSSSRVNLQQSI